jgi:hypothetical protein
MTFIPRRAKSSRVSLGLDQLELRYQETFTRERTDASQRDERAYLNLESNRHMEEQHDLHTLG